MHSTSLFHAKLTFSLSRLLITLFFFFSPFFADKFTFYLFLVVVISISALPVLARILSEYKLLSTPLGSFTINCTYAFLIVLVCYLLASTQTCKHIVLRRNITPTLARIMARGTHARTRCVQMLILRFSSQFACAYFYTVFFFICFCVAL